MICNNVVYFPLSLHKKLYSWILEDPSRRKKYWPHWKENGGNLEKPHHSAYCFACGFAIEYMNKELGYADDKLKCSYCPFEVNPNDSCLNGLYNKYKELKNNITEDNLIELKNVINGIINYPVKKNIKCI